MVDPAGITAHVREASLSMAVASQPPLPVLARASSTRVPPFVAIDACLATTGAHKRFGSRSPLGRQASLGHDGAELGSDRASISPQPVPFGVANRRAPLLAPPPASSAAPVPVPRPDACATSGHAAVHSLLGRMKGLCTGQLAVAAHVLRVLPLVTRGRGASSSSLSSAWPCPQT